MAIEVTSTIFKDGDDIPARYTCDGKNLSPPLNWTGVPQTAQSLALLMDDPDAPSGTYTHWILFNIPRRIEGLPEDVPKEEKLADGSRQCLNSSGNFGYTGPCPPAGHGSHRYYFRIYALDREIHLNKGSKREDFLTAIEGQVLEEGQLMGRFERQQTRATTT
jgi:Raf kinase inhibitor-like YbhB/YbcL family protein